MDSIPSDLYYEAVRALSMARSNPFNSKRFDPTTRIEGNRIYEAIHPVYGAGLYTVLLNWEAGVNMQQFDREMKMMQFSWSFLHLLAEFVLFPNEEYVLAELAILQLEYDVTLERAILQYGELDAPKVEIWCGFSASKKVLANYKKLVLTAVQVARYDQSDNLLLTRICDACWYHLPQSWLR